MCTILCGWQTFQLPNKCITKVGLSKIVPLRLSSKHPFSFYTDINNFIRILFKGNCIRPQQLESNILAVSAKEQDRMEQQAEITSTHAKEQDKNFWTSSAEEYEKVIEIIECEYGVKYNRQRPINTLVSPPLDLDLFFDIGRTYASMNVVGQIFMSWQVIQRERNRLQILIMAAIRQDSKLE